MRIIEILPELVEGGVERHVLGLSNGLVSRGHEVMVVSAGGKLETQLDERVRHWRLPVHLKNPITAAWAAVRIAVRVRSEGWQIFHAHSRVPSWIAWWASFLSARPWIVTCHALYSLNAGLFPCKRASAAICVSNAVMNHLKAILPKERAVIYNGLQPNSQFWSGSIDGEEVKLLFVGRLTRKKGLHVVLEALTDLKYEPWKLDVVGDGPMREELVQLVRKNGLSEKVFFHGYRDDVENWMAGCSCFLFPSLAEGMGLTLMQAIQMGVPILASDLPPVRELSDPEAELIDSGSVPSWREALRELFRGRRTLCAFVSERVPSISKMVETTERFYNSILSSDL